MFGNRIPNFTFEVKRKVLPEEIDGQPLEHQLKSMIMIPGSGEFVYDDTVQIKQSGEDAGSVFAQKGYDERVNMHNPQGKANGLVALDQLLETCPNLEWIGLVVTWFGDDLDAGQCAIKPAVEYQSDARTIPDSWAVAGYTRDTAPLMTFVDGVPRYGGTPSDASLLRYIDAIKAKGIKVMLYPMFFMDVEDKPWRGRVTGSIADVASFFTKTNGYNAFISHYANLTKNKVDAFVIGSELIGLTSVHDGATSYRHFPAVDALVNLAASVKTIMGVATKITYAADWSEYHHTTDGWYHLDPLWASPNIDFIGIDAYFPLTDESPESITLAKAQAGWTSGEGYDWVYSDASRTTQAAIADEYAWKNIAWWWENTHTNPDGNSTPWVAQSKPIWFTEMGFPSVDGATNQPNVFYDPSSSESFFPRSSQGRIDNAAQRLGLLATEMAWKDSTMIPQRFVWTWDARPFPYWPDLRSVWADGELWKTGHWVNGKLGTSGLAAIVAQLCAKAGLASSEVDVSRLSGTVEGYLLTRQQTVREAIEALMGAYFFDCVESNGQLKFVPRGAQLQQSIPQDDLLPQGTETQPSLLQLTRMQEMELPQQVSVIYLNRAANYQTGHQLAQRARVSSQEKATLNLPIVMGQGQAQQIAETSLFTAWMGRSAVEFTLPPCYMALEPCDVIEVAMQGVTHQLRITHTALGEGYSLQIRGVLEDVSTYTAYAEDSDAQEPLLPATVSETQLHLLDMPLLPGDVLDQAVLRVAMSAQGGDWRGAVLYASADNEQNWQTRITTTQEAVSGTVTAIPQADCQTATLDQRSQIIVNLLGDASVSSVNEVALFNGANAALVGQEVLQFQNAELVAQGKYRLTGLLRGRLGTEWAMDQHNAGERFVLLNDAVLKDEKTNNLIGLERHYRAVTIGSTLGKVSSTAFTHQGVGLKPYAPVHVKGLRDSSGNLTINWIRRARGENGWRDFVDAPLNETSEAYDIEVLSGSNVVRTLTASTTEVSYTTAQQITDFGSTQSSVSLRIYQLSAAIGRGYGAQAIV